ncbi:MAG: hypothetical protein FOGNACKC_00745 [Anaerolineae bacterium]|nr:hypothetical protein [Anaerolineae bacterium]
MSRDHRIELIRKIEQKRNSKVIAYVTSDRHNLAGQIAGDTISILHEHILALAPAERAKLDLFIYSRGGNSDTPWSIVSMFREYSKEGSFSILIPYRAHSAATLISLGADEIVMTKKAELGPIDITISSGPYNPKDTVTHERLPVSVEDVMGYFALLEKLNCERPEEKMKGFEQLTRKVHPLVLGTVSRLLEQTKLVALRLLGTRAKPFAEEKNREIIKRLSSEIYSHLHTISRAEARQLGLDQVVSAEDAGIDEELWDLYKEYRTLFSLEEPFVPDQYLIAQNLEDHTWSSLNMACVESEARFDVFQKDIRVKQLRQVPPQVAINLNNIALPAIENINPQIVDQLLREIIQPVIERAVEDARKSLLASLPIAGFEHIEYNVGWKTIDGGIEV